MIPNAHIKSSGAPEPTSMKESLNREASKALGRWLMSGEDGAWTDFKSAWIRFKNQNGPLLQQDKVLEVLFNFSVSSWIREHEQPAESSEMGERRKWTFEQLLENGLNLRARVGLYGEGEVSLAEAFVATGLTDPLRSLMTAGLNINEVLSRDGGKEERLLDRVCAPKNLNRQLLNKLWVKERPKLIKLLWEQGARFGGKKVLCDQMAWGILKKLNQAGTPCRTLGAEDWKKFSQEGVLYNEFVINNYPTQTWGWGKGVTRLSATEREALGTQALMQLAEELLRNKNKITSEEPFWGKKMTQFVLSALSMGGDPNAQASNNEYLFNLSLNCGLIDLCQILLLSGADPEKHKPFSKSGIELLDKKMAGAKLGPKDDYQMIRQTLVMAQNIQQRLPLRCRKEIVESTLNAGIYHCAILFMDGEVKAPGVTLSLDALAETPSPSSPVILRLLVSEGFKVEASAIQKMDQPHQEAIREEAIKAYRWQTGQEYTDSMDGPHTALEATELCGPEGEKEKESNKDSEQILINQLSVEQLNALLLSATLKNEQETIKSVLLAGGEIDSRDENGLSALLIAAQLGDPQTVQMLLTAGANPWAESWSGEGVLDFASLSQNEEGAAQCMILCSAKRKERIEEKEKLQTLKTPWPTGPLQKRKII